MQEPMLVLGGDRDTLSPDSSVSSYYESMPANITRALAIFKDTTHSNWMGTGAQPKKSKFKVMITAWLNLQMKGGQSARTYFDGAEHAEHQANDWFTQYEYRP